MFDVEMLGVLLFFCVSLFDNYKKSKAFFFIVIITGALLGIINYIIPTVFPEQFVEAAKQGIYIALGVSGLLGLAKNRITNQK